MTYFAFGARFHEVRFTLDIHTLTKGDVAHDTIMNLRVEGHCVCLLYFMSILYSRIRVHVELLPSCLILRGRKEALSSFLSRELNSAGFVVAQTLHLGYKRPRG